MLSHQVGKAVTGTGTFADGAAGGHPDAPGTRRHRRHLHPRRQRPVPAEPDHARWRCDAHRADPSLAFELSHLAERPTGPTPIGVFRDIERGVYGEALAREIIETRANVGVSELEKLLHAGDTWTVS